MHGKPSIIATATVPIALACGNSGRESILPLPDVGMHDAGDYCLVAPTYGAPAVPGRSTDYKQGLLGSDSMGNPSPHEIVYFASLDNAALRDILFVALFAGRGVFTGDIEPGTYTIGG